MVPILVGIVLMTHAGAQAQTYTFVAVDANPAGSQPTSPGTIDPCVQVSAGSTFDVDIQVREVVKLQGWEAYLVYDAAALEVTNKNVKLFQAADPATNIVDGSEPLPDDGDGGYQLAASEFGFSADSGSGVLARITMRAKAPGLYSVSLPQIDRNSDGAADLGVILADSTGHKIGDLDGDNFFDGTAYSTQIAIDVPCPQSTPVPTPPPLPTTPTPPPPPEPTLPPTLPPSSAPPTAPPTTTGAVTTSPSPSGTSAASGSATVRVTDDPTATGADASRTDRDDRDQGGDAGQTGSDSSGDGPAGEGSSGVNFVVITLISLATVVVGATMAGGFALYNRSRSRDSL